MRKKPSQMFPALLVLLAPMLGAGAADTDLPERERIHHSYELAHGATVEVSGIAGPVEIETTNDDMADVNVVRSAPTRADLDCGKIVIEQTSTRLRISSESNCPIVRGRQSVTLKLPRRADLSVQTIAGDVRIGPTEGMVRLESIAGHVAVTELRAASMNSLAGGLRMSIAGVGERGIHISSVTGGIDMDVRKGVDAELMLKSVVGHVRSDTSDVSISEGGDSDYQAVIGSGGSKILIESVVGGVDIRRGR
jgi:DUF4097 and DUF4098 domain-containing protein YvlB